MFSVYCQILMKEYKINPTAGTVLGFLYDSPMSGWDLLKKISRYTGNFWSTTTSQVYRELTLLEKAKYVSKAGDIGQHKRQTFTITTEGKQAFESWIQSFNGNDSIRIPFLIHIAFAKHISFEQMNKQIKKQQEHHHKQLQMYTEIRAKIQDKPQDERNKYALANLEFGIDYETMVLNWLKKLPKQLGD